MLIRLTIENVDDLPDGLPLHHQAENRGFDIGREGCEWTLPDPRKLISGHHCEVVWHTGAFWLRDTSRNGTFLNGSSERMAGPHRLSDGDRVRIGHYIVSVALTDAAAPGDAAGARAQPPPAGRQPAAPHAPGVPRGTDPGGRPVPHGNADALLQAIADGARVPAELFRQREAEEVAREIGAVLRTTVDELALLLRARATAKAMARSGHRTMIGSLDNNPLKFVPAAEEIFEIMFTRRRPGYLDAERSVKEAFDDLKTHEMATYAAMQSALARLIEDLSPETIETKVPASTFSSRKARAWDMLVAVWSALEDQHENGMLDVFLEYFGEAYARSSREK